MPTQNLVLPTRGPRRLLPDQLEINSWDILEPYYEELKNRQIQSVQDLEEWLLDRSELEAVLEEDLAWRYIKMNIDTTDADLAASFQMFVNEIEPKIAPYDHYFNGKMVNSPFLDELDQDKYKIYLRKVRNAIEIYREKNIPLFSQVQTDAQQYSVITGKMTVEVDGNELTMQSAAKYLREPGREKREEVYHKIKARRLQEREALHELFNHLLDIRNRIATNADFPNFRDYMFSAMGRFDYSVEDCYDFHESIRKEILPIVHGFQKERKADMDLDQLRPWDLEVDPLDRPALKPFNGGQELIEKTIRCFQRIRPEFGEFLYIMKEMGHLDLDSKKGKAPGGFNYPLYEIGVPFVYMNAVGSFRDVVTMVHEGGHAIHSFLSRDLKLTSFKNLTSEIAELASMSMELISMEHWDVFYEDEKELVRAKRQQLEQIISILPWIAQIDKYQHWVYENPEHTIEERKEKWMQIHQDFSTGLVYWEGHEDFRSVLWQKQMHLFEVPFYYIEYGMAQLGAIAVWRNYKENPDKAIDQYIAALELGYTRSIGNIYEAAGIRFDFSAEYVRELAAFVKEELAKL